MPGAAIVQTRADRATVGGADLVAFAGCNYLGLAHDPRVLAAVREANTAPPPFGPTDVEKRFGSLMDAERASGLVKGANWGIVDRLTADLIGRHERAAAAGGVDLRVDPRGA
jgi:hypothetical protein